MDQTLVTSGGNGLPSGCSQHTWCGCCGVLVLPVIELGGPVHPEKRSLGFKVGLEWRGGQPLFRAIVPVSSHSTGQFTNIASVSLCMCVCTHACFLGVKFGCYSLEAIQLFLFFFKIGPHWGMGLTSWLGWLAREPQKSHCLCL